VRHRHERRRLLRWKGITKADASVVLLADNQEAVLLANDKGLIEVA
jgi:predicted nucleic acid-binding protein